MISMIAMMKLGVAMPMIDDTRGQVVGPAVVAEGGKDAERDPDDASTG